MGSVNKTLSSEQTTAINPAKTIHRATTSIGLCVPYTTTIITVLTTINPTPCPHTTTPPPYLINSKGKTAS
jgi:hypothetical protein